jgi:hypothetical protein
VVVPSPAAAWSRVTPFVATVSSLGAVTSKRYAALSDGWSLTGKNVAAPSGSEATKAPWPNVCHPTENESAPTIPFGAPS